MKKELYRQKSIERVSSPEQLNDYIKVSSPGVWAVLAAVVVLLIGALVWSVFSRLENTVPAVVVVEDGRAVCFYGMGYGSEVEAGMTVSVGDAQLSIGSVSTAQLQLVEDLAVGTYLPGQGVYVSELEGTLDDGVYEAEIVVESLSPISLLWR